MELEKNFTVYYFELANLKKQFCSLKEMVLDILLKVNHALKHLHKHPQHPHNLATMNFTAKWRKAIGNVEMPLIFPI